MNLTKRKVTDLLQNEAILISNDFERDVILQLMEDAGMDWADGEKATNWNPIQVGYEYPFVLFNHPHDIGCIAFRAFGDQINILPILNATDFINTEAEKVEHHRLFDHSEPTVLAELKDVINESMSKENESFDRGWNAALEMVLEEIALRKPTEIDKLKQAFAEGYVQTESAESWAKKFKQ